MEETSKYCTFYIVRHGNSLANQNKIVAGITDSTLTPLGESQATAKGLSFKDIKFDAVFSSDLVRAKRTAELITAQRQLTVNTTKLLRERDFGEWEGKSEQDFREGNKELIAKINTLSEEQRHHLRYGQGYESNDEIATRLLAFLREVAVAYLGKTVLVVSHGSIMRSCLIKLGFARYQELPASSIENTGHFILESDGVDFFIKETFGVNKLTIKEN